MLNNSPISIGYRTIDNDLSCDRNVGHSTLNVCLALVAPSVGLLSPFVLDYLRFQKYLIHVCLSTCYLSQNSTQRDELGILVDLYNKLQLRHTLNSELQLVAHNKHFWKKVTCGVELTHPCLQPWPFFYSFVLFLLLTVSMMDVHIV